MGLTYTQGLFIVFAAVALSSALAVIFTRHTVYAAFFFIAHLLGLSVLYALLDAPLLAVLQIMIYAGAVMVLFLFAIMILDASILARMDFRKELFHAALALLVTLALGSLLYYFGARGNLSLALAVPAPVDPLASQAGNVASIGRMLYRQYLFPFELISVILIVSIIGIMVMAKKKLED